jgi:hypothetical protein
MFVEEKIKVVFFSVIVSPDLVVKLVRILSCTDEYGRELQIRRVFFG